MSVFSRSLCGAALAAFLTFPVFAQNETFQTRLQAAKALMKQGRYADARTAFTALLDETRAREGDSIRVAIVSDFLGCAAHDLGEYAEADRLFNRALAILKKSGGAVSPDATTVRMHIGELYWEEGRAKEAEKLLADVVAAREHEPSSTPADIANARIDLALAQSSQGRKREAEQLLRAALPPIEAEYGADSPMLLSVLDPLASVLCAQQRYREALPYSERAWSIISKSPQVSGPDRVNTTIALSALYSMTGQPSEAAYFAKEGLALVESVYAQDNPRMGWFLRNYAAVLRRLNRKEDAKAADKRADAILASTGARYGSQTVNVSALR